MKIYINTDAACFHQYGFMSYAFWINGENINIQDFGVVQGVYHSMEAEYIAVHKALDALIEFSYDFEHIVINRDNIAVTNKFVTKRLLKLTRGLKFKCWQLTRATNLKFGEKQRHIHLKYVQARKGIDDDMKRNKWCDRKAKETGRKELYKYGNFNRIKARLKKYYNDLITQDIMGFNDKRDRIIGSI